MSIKTTQRIGRQKSVEILNREISTAPSSLLEELLDYVANSGRSQTLSKFDNFIVSEFEDAK